MNITSVDLEYIIFRLPNDSKQIKLTHLFPHALKDGKLYLDNIDFTRLGVELHIDFSDCVLTNCHFKFQKLCCDFTHATVESASFECCFIDPTCKGLKTTTQSRLQTQALFSDCLPIERRESEIVKNRRISLWQQYLMTHYGAELVQYQNIRHYSISMRPIFVLTEGGFWYGYITPFTERDFESLLGWKLHISVQVKDIERAYDLIVRLILPYQIDFKVINRDANHVLQGKQIAIYITQDNKPIISPDTVKELIEEITSIFQKEGIAPGTVPISDRVINPFFSIRNDRYQFGSYVDYVSADAIGRNFNPSNLPNPFQNLLKDPKKFSLGTHFQSFAGARQSIYFMFTYSLEAFLREYTLLDLITITDKVPLYQSIANYYFPLRDEIIDVHKKNDVNRNTILTVASILSCLSFVRQSKRLLKSFDFSSWYLEQDNFLSELQQIEKVINTVNNKAINTSENKSKLNLVEFTQIEQEWAKQVDLKRIHPSLHAIIMSEEASPHKKNKVEVEPSRETQFGLR